MNSKEYWGLMEAYAEVYAPQKEFQLWVNSLLEEGYDLSDYTWEDMYEAYLGEQGVRTGSNPNVYKPTPTSPGSRRGAAPVPSSSSTGSVTSQRGRVTGSSSNNAFSQAERSGGTRRGAAAGTRGQGGRPLGSTTQRGGAATPAPKPAPALRGQGNNLLRRPGDPGRTSQPTTRIDRGSRPTPAAKPAPTPAAKPAPAPTPTARPAASVPKPAASVPKPAPTTSGYKKDTSITDMIGRSQVRQGAPINTGNKSSDIRAMAARGTDFGGAGSSAPKPAPTTRPMGSKKPGSVYSGFDMFDLVKGHLLDEGYADTEEAAIAIMANMSEEWRDSILSEDPVQDYRDMKRSKENAAGMRGPELSHSSKGTTKPGSATITKQPRSREFSHGGSTPRGREFTNPPS